MGFHDQIALSARLDGHTAAMYRHSAQKHADATWVYLIIAAVVWYFFAWYWALIPAVFAIVTAIQSMSATAVAMKLEKYERG